MRRRASSSLGFPTVRDEEWRFTNVSPIASTEFRRAIVEAGRGRRSTRSCYATRRCGWLSSTAGSRRSCRGAAVFRLASEFGSLATAATDQADVVEPVSRLSSPNPTRARCSAQHRVHARRRVRLGSGRRWCSSSRCRCCSSRRLTVASQAATMSHPRTLIVAGDDSQARIVETYVGPPGQKYFTNAVTEVVAARTPCSITTRCRRRASTRSTSRACTSMRRAARTFSSHSFALGGKHGPERHRRRARRRRRRVHAERPLSRRRRAPRRQSHDDRSREAALPEPRGLQGHHRRQGPRGVQRQDHRPQDAQKTDAKQTNRALLLSDDATINTKPQLEIFADDVKCTHGAAIGQLDEDALFYLRARGLTLPKRATC